VKGNIKTQVLVVKEGAHWEGGVTMTREPGARPAATPTGPGNQPAQRQGAGAAATGGAGGSSGSIFSKGDRQAEQAGAESREGQPAGQGGGGQ
jgi:hypothetical protein